MILVTGATGFIGGHLVERLAAEGRPVRCLVRRATHLNTQPAVEVASGDLAAGVGLRDAVRGVDTVIHLAGITKALTRDAYYESNYLATANLVRVASGVRRFVHVSSLAAAGPSAPGEALTEDAEPDPISHYGRSKLAGEEAVQHSELWDRAIIVRPPVVYGPRDRDVYQVLRSISRGWMLQVGSAPRRFSFIYVCDLVDGLIAAATSDLSGGRIFYLANAEPASWQEFAATAARLMNRRVRSVTVPESAAYAVGLCAEWYARVRGKPGILSRDKIAEACCTGWVCDPARARRELGFRATTSLETGLRRTLDWYREAGWLTW